MCFVFISKEMDLEFIVYNLAFASKSGKISINGIYEQLLERNIKVPIKELEGIFKRWNDEGTLFDIGNEYLINTIRT